MLKMSTVHAPTDSLKLLFFFFLLMNSSSSGLMSYCTLTIEFLELKYYTNYLFYQLFLSPPDFFFPLILSAASSSSSFFFPLILSVAIAVAFLFPLLINQMKSEEKKKKEKEKREKRETCSWAKELIQTQNTKHKTKSNS